MQTHDVDLGEWLPVVYARAHSITDASAHAVTGREESATRCHLKRVQQSPLTALPRTALPVLV